VSTQLQYIYKYIIPYHILLFHHNSAPQCYTVRTLPILLWVNFYFPLATAVLQSVFSWMCTVSLKMVW